VRLAGQEIELLEYQGVALRGDEPLRPFDVGAMHLALHVDIWTLRWSEYGVTDGSRKVHALDAQCIQGFYGVNNESREKEDFDVSTNNRYVRWGLRTSRKRRDRQRKRSTRSWRQQCGHDDTGRHGAWQ
jgi:hypothetical protein